MLFFLISTEIQSQKILTKTYKAGIKYVLSIPCWHLSNQSPCLTAELSQMTGTIFTISVTMLYRVNNLHATAAWLYAWYNTTRISSSSNDSNKCKQPYFSKLSKIPTILAEKVTRKVYVNQDIYSVGSVAQMVMSYSESTMLCCTWWTMSWSTCSSKW